jgi:hypothetical protein
MQTDGAGRIGELNTTWEYHLGDGLRSVRQRTNGSVSFLKIYTSKLIIQQKMGAILYPKNTC